MQKTELLESARAHALRLGSQQTPLVEAGGWMRPELLPVSGSRFADLSVERLTDYQRNRLGDPELPESHADWQRRDWTRLPVVEIVSYVDRLEITSPGALPSSMTLDKVLAGRRSRRNTLLVDVMRDYGDFDACGMGLRRKIVPSVRAASGQDARFEATEDYVRVILPRAFELRES
jgi:hypothetical protein